MTLKSAAFIALIGTLLSTLVLVYNFINVLLNATRGLVPEMMLFPALVYAFTSLAVTLFFFVFYKQS